MKDKEYMMKKERVNDTKKIPENVQNYTDQSQNFLVTLCNVYFVCLLVVLPLYVGHGYEELGDAKYLLFRNVSFICVGLFVAVGGFFYIRGKLSRNSFPNLERQHGSCIYSDYLGNNDPSVRGVGIAGWSPVFCWVIVYGIWNLISAVSSKFQHIAWLGYEEWYMGAITQCLMVGIYMIALWYGKYSKVMPEDTIESPGYILPTPANGSLTQKSSIQDGSDSTREPLTSANKMKSEKWNVITILGLTSLTVVTILGLLQTLNIDVLGLFKNYGYTDWVRGHTLSTLGNINWLCGFYSVLFAWSLSIYFQVKRKWLCWLLGCLNGMVTVLLLLQGSDGGVLIVAVAFFIGVLLTCYKEESEREVSVPPLFHEADRQEPSESLQCRGASEQGSVAGAQYNRLLCLAIGSSMLLVLWKTLAKFRGTVDIMFQDGYAKTILLWKGWPLVTITLLIVWLIHKKMSSRQAMIMRRCMLGIMIAFILTAAVGIMYKLRTIPFSQWGNYRGSLWQMAWEGFLEGDWKQKLLGAGPDCFAPYLNQLFPDKTVLFHTGYFAGSVFTNAHNEWLTLLVNLGIPGVICYAGIFISAFRRYRRKPLAMFLLGLYGIHSLVSFQQVLNAPFFFLMLGLCENQ